MDQHASIPGPYFKHFVPRRTDTVQYSSVQTDDSANPLLPQVKDKQVPSIGMITFKLWHLWPRQARRVMRTSVVSKPSIDHLI